MTRSTPAALAAGIAALALVAGCSGSGGSDDGSAGADETSSAPEDAGDDGGAITVTDMVGREVSLDQPATTVATAGPPAEVLIYTFGTDYMAGWNRPVDPERAEYMPDEVTDLPEVGRISSDGGDLDVEGLLSLGVDLIIDAGNLDDSYVQAADDLQEQTGIPVLQFSTDPDDLDEVYTILGEVLGDEDRGAELADAADAIVAEVSDGAAEVDDPVSVYYGAGDDGLQTAPSGSIHSLVIDLIGAENAADLPAESASGRVDVDAEQVLGWDPDVLILGPGSMDDPIAQDPASEPAFEPLRAVADGEVYVAPTAPFGWFDGPPSANQLLGMLWGAEAVYPDVYDIDLVAETVSFYDTFYHYDLSEEDATAMLEASGLTL